MALNTLKCLKKLLEGGFIKTLTIFTPTYNREMLLNRLYKSLSEQTSKDFEWLIVDDGSTDNTGKIVEDWIHESLISIRYIYQPNGGKMRAHNKGVLNSSTELFFCVDSDDYLVSDAVEQIILLWRENYNEQLAGIVAMRGFDEFTTMTGCQLPEISQSTLSNIYRNGFKGDTALIFKTKILKNYLFPEIENEKFITEKYIYDQIDQEYELLVCNKIVTICEYLDDGYTKNAFKLLIDNPKGWAMFYNQCINLEINFKEKYYNACRFVAVSIIARDFRFINKVNKKCMCFIAIPGGIILCLKKIVQLKSVSKKEKNENKA